MLKNVHMQLDQMNLALAHQLEQLSPVDSFAFQEEHIQWLKDRREGCTTLSRHQSSQQVYRLQCEVVMTKNRLEQLILSTH